jgi:hypothetical protein
VANGNNSGEKWALMQGAVGVIVVVGLFANQAAWMLMLANNTSPQTNFDPAILAILNQLTGVTAALAGVAVNYYFGSSKGSKDKDDAINQSIKTSTDAVATLAAGTGSGTIKSVSPQTKQQMSDAAAEHFSKGEYTEDQFRATLRALGYADAEIDVAVQKYKPGGG